MATESIGGSDILVDAKQELEEAVKILALGNDSHSSIVRAIGKIKYSISCINVKLNPLGKHSNG